MKNSNIDSDLLDFEVWNL